VPEKDRNTGEDRTYELVLGDDGLEEGVPLLVLDCQQAPHIDLLEQLPLTDRQLPGWWNEESTAPPSGTELGRKEDLANIGSGISMKSTTFFDGLGVTKPGMLGLSVPVSEFSLAAGVAVLLRRRRSLISLASVGSFLAHWRMVAICRDDRSPSNKKETNGQVSPQKKEGRQEEKHGGKARRRAGMRAAPSSSKGVESGKGEGAHLTFWLGHHDGVPIVEQSCKHGTLIVLVSETTKLPPRRGTSSPTSQRALEWAKKRRRRKEGMQATRLLPPPASPWSARAWYIARKGSCLRPFSSFLWGCGSPPPSTCWLGLRGWLRWEVLSVCLSEGSCLPL
jgi:hypothetical protein